MQCLHRGTIRRGLSGAESVVRRWVRVAQLQTDHAADESGYMSSELPESGDVSDFHGSLE